MKNVRIGLFGIELDVYWLQFERLEQRLKGYLHEVEKHLIRPGVEVVNLGLIDNAPKAIEAGHRFRQEDVDLIFLHVTTYALSSTVLPVVTLRQSTCRPRSATGTGDQLRTVQ